MTKVTVIFEREHKTQTIQFVGKNVEALLKHLKINPETVIVTRQGEVITEQEALAENDTLEILSVISGG